MPSGAYSPYCRINYYRRVPGGASLVGPYQLNALSQVSASNTTTNGVNQAQVQVFDPNQIIGRTLQINPMDVITLEVNSVYNQRTLAPIWAGYVDIATSHMDLQTGNVMVINCSSPYKLWENTTINLGVGTTTAQELINNPFNLAIASISGISAENVVKATASAVNYPGPLRDLPFNPNIYTGPGTAVAGLWSLTVPDNMASQPDLQTYSAIVQGMLADTATELFFDEQANLIFREVGYLNPNALPTMPNAPLIPRRILAQDIISSDLGRSDQGVITEVRVRWNYDQVFSQDGYWVAPQGIINQLGNRVHVINAPWLMNQQAAMFLAKAVGQMSASGVAVGSITMPLDPSYRIGMLCQVQDAYAPAGSYSLYYIVGIVYSMTWGQPWTMTVQLGYGRAPSQQFPYIGTESIPLLSDFKASQAQGGNASAGIPNGNGLTFTNGQLTDGASTTFDGTLKSEQITANPNVLPVGSVVILTDANGKPIGPSRTGTYTVVKGGTAGQAGIGINAKISDPVSYTVVSTGSVTASVTTGSSGTAPGVGTPAPSVAPPQGGVIAGTYAPDGTLVAAPATAPTSFPYWPIDPVNGLAQKFGPTQVSGEPPYTDSQGRYSPMYHLGIDIGTGYGGMPTIMAPVGGGTVIFASWDNTGYGNCTCLQVGPLVLLFGHQDHFLVKVGDQPTANSPIGVVDHTGNVYPQGPGGDHLHFGVFDTRIGYWVDPEPYLAGATR